MQVAILWSSNPEFYETLTGGPELTGKIITKINTDVKILINRFNMEKKNDIEGFMIYSNSDGICAVSEVDEPSSNRINNFIKSNQHLFHHSSGL